MIAWQEKHMKFILVATMNKKIEVSASSCLLKLLLTIDLVGQLKLTDHFIDVLVHLTNLLIDCAAKQHLQLTSWVVCTVLVFMALKWTQRGRSDGWSWQKSYQIVMDR